MPMSVRLVPKSKRPSCGLTGSVRRVMWSVIAFAGSFALYAALVLARPDPHGLPRAVALAGVLVATGGFFLRSRVEDTSLAGTLWAGALLNVVILGVTAGRPSELFDSLDKGALEAMPSDERALAEARIARVERNQLIFLGVVIFGVLLYELAGTDFLD